MVMESTLVPAAPAVVTLDKWLTHRGRGALVWLASETGIAYDLLWRYRRLSVIPGYDNAIRIEVATSGQVTAMSLMSGRKRPRTKARAKPKQRTKIRGAA